MRIVLSTVLFLGLPSASVAGETKETIEAEARLKKDVTLLASPDFEGRGPGTKGINKAADHIAAEFKKAGFKGAMPDGSYFQPFQVRGPSRPGQPTSLKFKSSDGTLIGVDMDNGFAPLALGGGGKATGKLMFAGYGITAPKVEFDDYQDIDVKGKIVMILRKTPRYGVKEKPFADADTSAEVAALATKIENAEKHGAAAVIIVNDRATAAETNDEMSGQFGAYGTRSVGKIPAVMMKRTAADLLLQAAKGKTLKQIEEEVDRELSTINNGPVGKWMGDVEVTVDRNRQIDVKNVVGVLEGSGPFADETIVIGAHYDHLGYGGSGSLGGTKSAIHYGADDNASGTTAILELARRLGARKDRDGRRIVIMTFSAEEMGLLGSAHYTKNPIFPLEKTVAMINLDMVGRLREENGEGKLEIGGLGTAKQFEGMIDKLNDKHKFKVKKTQAGMGPSDHQSFFLKNVPVLFFFTGLHPDYHRPSDTPDKINVSGMRKIVDMVEEIAVDLAERSDKLEFVKVAGRMSPSDPTAAPRNLPRLGIMFDYADTGEGALVEGLTEGGAAEAAKMKKGDRIIAVAGQPVKDVTGYMSAMTGKKRGEELELTILRDGKKETIKVTPK